MVRTILIIVICCLTAYGAATATDDQSADLIIFNGTIHTLNPQQPSANMVAVQDAHIVYAGDKSAMERWSGPSTQVIDLKGRTMTPGLIESHAHILYLGYARMNLDLSRAKNYAQVVAMVAEAVAGLAPGEWILGSGWHQSKWDPQPARQVKGFQTHHALSRSIPDHPVFLTHASGHAGMANAAAMRIAGIDAQTQFKQGGEIIRDGLGNPTGIFTEAAQNLIRKHIPPTTPPPTARPSTCTGSF